MKIMIGIVALATAVLLLLDWNFVRFRLLDESLSPMFFSGQKVVTSRTAYFFENPRHGDLVVYSHAEGIYLTGRVIATAGDRVALSQGEIIVNDKIVAQSISQGDLSLPEMAVPANHICLESSSSGLSLIPLSQVMGKILGQWQVLII